METDEFALALDELANLACAVTTAIMCAEAVWWRCHRSMIADAMKWAGFEVRHIMAPGKVVEHPWTSAARVVKGELSYERALGQSHGFAPTRAQGTTTRSTSSRSIFPKYSSSTRSLSAVTIASRS
jgi:hypothetical protein